MEKMPENLPEIEKQDIPEEEKFTEETGETVREKSRKLWIIILAFALLASLGVIVWLVFSGRSDQKIHGENLELLMGEAPEENTTEKLGNIDPGTVVNDAEINLTDYDTNVTITASGEYTLSGILNASVLVNSDGPVVLNLNGVTISSIETAAIANQTSNSLTINLLENTTNTLTDGGSSVYDAALFSKGELTINAFGSDNTLGKLIVSGRQIEGEGIATEDANLTINSGKIMISSADDGVNTGGDNGGTLTVNGGVLWVKASGDGLDSNKNIAINGGNILVMGSTSGGDAALDADSGVAINGGNVVALGSDMLENPLSSSTQKFLAVALTSSIPTGSTVYIKNIDENRLVNFSTQSDFSTLIYSAPSLTAGNYEISVDGVVYGTGTVE